MNKILTLICLLGFCFVSYSQTPVDSMSKSREYLDSVHKASIDSIRAITDILKRNQWKIDEYVDKFKDKTGEKFVYAFCTGTFSNTATTNSRLYVGVSLDKNVVRFDLRE